jgi:4-hydroxy-tetrahydrodipicolinate synthase
MNRAELQKLIVGPVATVPTPFDANHNVDYGRMHELVQWWVENGIVKGKGIVKIAAAMGEGFHLSDDEWPPLLSTTVNAANDKATIVCGLHYKDTVRTIDDAKRAQDLGAVGLQISPPIFVHPTQDDLLRHFQAISDAIEIGILVYHTHWFAGGRMELDTIMKLGDMENVVAFKWSNAEGQKFEDMALFSDKMNVIDNTLQPIESHKLGGKGYINETMAAYPAHDLKVQALIDDGKYDEAQALWDSVTVPIRAFYDTIAPKSGGEGRLVKGLMEIMGQPCGVSRPPSLPLSADEKARLREVVQSFGWPVA